MRQFSKQEVAVRDARGKLAWLMPYFHRPIYALVFYETESVPTMAIDRWRRVYFNPQFVKQLSVDQLVIVLFHELSHALRRHHERAISLGVTPQNKTLVQICQDLEINDDIEDEVRNSQREVEAQRLAPIPTWKITSGKHAGKTASFWFPRLLGLENGKTWEQYYYELLDLPRVKDDQQGGIALPIPHDGNDDDGEGNDCSGGGHDCGSGAHGIRRPWEHGEPGVESDADGISDVDWLDIELQAAAAIMAERQRGRGSVPAGWIRWAERLLTVEPIPWDQLLEGSLRNTISTAAGMVLHTWQRPSRRAAAMPNVILPHMRRPKPEIVIIGDTSGSMSTNDLALVRGTVESLCESLGVEPTFISVDAQVYDAQTVSGGSDIEFEGGGGTDMCCGIDTALDRVPMPDAIVVITDCATPWPETETPVPLIVCDVTNYSKDSVPSWAEYIGVTVATEES